MKTKMAVLYNINQPLVIEELEIPQLKSGQVLVKVLFSGICGSQLSEVEGRLGPDRFIPHTLGHEGSGIVIDVGRGVTKVKVDDHVIISWIKGAGLNSLPPCYYAGKRKINAGFANTFTEYSIVSENRLVAIRKEMPLDKASILGCAVATGFGAVVNEAKVSRGSNVLVSGTGGVGLSVIQAAALAGVLKLIVLGRNNIKLEMARCLGATDVFNLLDNNVVSKIRKVTDNNGVDYAFEATGERFCMELDYKCTRNDGGKVVLIGIPKYQESIAIDPMDLFKGKSIIGTSGGRTNPDREFLEYVDLYLSGKLQLDQMITHRFKLHEINNALKLLKNGGGLGRAILEL